MVAASFGVGNPRSSRALAFRENVHLGCTKTNHGQYPSANKATGIHMTV